MMGQLFEARWWSLPPSPPLSSSAMPKGGGACSFIVVTKVLLVVRVINKRVPNAPTITGKRSWRNIRRAAVDGAGYFGRIGELVEVAANARSILGRIHEGAVGIVELEVSLYLLVLLVAHIEVVLREDGFSCEELEALGMVPGDGCFSRPGLNSGLGPLLRTDGRTGGTAGGGGNIGRKLLAGPEDPCQEKKTDLWADNDDHPGDSGDDTINMDSSWKKISKSRMVVLILGMSFTGDCHGDNILDVLTLDRWRYGS